jgi:uncharacterized protein
MQSVVMSFLALISIPVLISVITASAGRLWCRKPWPPARTFIRDGVISVALTAGITVAICVVLAWTGFTESQFYRPSARDFGEHTQHGLAPRDVFFQSKDGTLLHGWFLASDEPAGGTVIHLHGSDRNISYTIRNSHWLIDRGFNLFVFDYRGYGKSEGRPSRRGVIEDTVAAIEHVRSRPDVDADKIVLWGQSMGGQLAIVGADLAGGAGIRAVVAEATYASHAHHVKDKLAGMGPLWLIQWGAWLVTSDTQSARDIVDDLAPTPVLLVHGSDDRAVRPYHSEWLFQAAREPKAHWHVQGARHLEVFQDKIYRERLEWFFRQALEAEEQIGAENSVERSSEQEPADSLSDKSNVIGGWLPSLTFAFA